MYLLVIGLLSMSTILFAADGATKVPGESENADTDVWGKLIADGLILELKSKTELRWFLFHPPGSVSASLGVKGGASMAPLWDYKISGKWIQILGDDGKMLFQMLPIKVTATEISVDNGRGETEVYEIKQAEGFRRAGAPIPSSPTTENKKP